MADDPQPPADKDKARAPEHAAHGYRNEVTWNGGQGRQPYGNQPEAAAADTAPQAFHEVEGGDRGEHSGTTQEQMRQVRGTPQVPPTRQSQP